MQWILIVGNQLQQKPLAFPDIAWHLPRLMIAAAHASGAWNDTNETWDVLPYWFTPSPSQARGLPPVSQLRSTPGCHTRRSGCPGIASSRVDAHPRCSLVFKPKAKNRQSLSKCEMECELRLSVVNIMYGYEVSIMYALIHTRDASSSCCGWCRRCCFRLCCRCCGCCDWLWI